MILAAGLTPAWQQILLFERFLPGEVNRASEVHWCASGKVLNVGLALHHLGVESRTLALVGGAAGDSIRAEFARLGVAADWVQTRTPTRICTTLLDQTTGLTTELVENSRAVSAAELVEFQSAFAALTPTARAVVLTGSLPAGTPGDFYRRLIERVRAPVVLDARGPELLESLSARPFLVKPNREELSRTLGMSLESDAELVLGLRQLVERGAEWVVISQGSESVWLAGATGLWRIWPPKVDVVNPIGSGDCLAAGIAAALARGLDPVAAARFGVAAGAVNALELLPARLQTDRVDRLAKTIAVERVP